MAEGQIIPNPQTASLNKNLPGITDISVGAGGVYKFMGCSVLSINMTLGFNSSPSSCSLTLVEDTVNGDSFVEPTIPSIWAVSLPKGGVGQPILYPGGINLTPDKFYPDNTPFYFAGICNNYSETLLDVSGRTISVSLVDPREILSGVQCLLGGFSLSHEVGTGNLDNNIDVRNIIDCFGYFDYGWDSLRNEYGMQWTQIIKAILDTRITIHDIDYEFTFNGGPFQNTPSWYRIEDQVIDLLGMCQRVAQDGGADFIAVGRKASATEMVVELRSIDRTVMNPLTQGDIQRFIAARGDIVSVARQGVEQRPEPTSSIIIGGMRNCNYLAYPAQYVANMHVKTVTNSAGNQVVVENYDSFPPDIKTRLFGGTTQVWSAPDVSVIPKLINATYSVNSGAIYPCWGFTPDDFAYPLIEPFLFLDYLVFDKITNLDANLKGRIPNCNIQVNFYPVRQVYEPDLFLQGDGSNQNDIRPFAYLHDYNISQNPGFGYVKGLPINTECLRASLASEEAFWGLYSLYYPDIGVSLGIPKINSKGIEQWLNSNGANSSLAAAPIEQFISIPQDVVLATAKLPGANPDGSIPANLPIWDVIGHTLRQTVILDKFRSIIYDAVQKYAQKWMGSYLVCLPFSFIMLRIWFNLPVPTRPERPQIEYVLSDRGFFETVPTDFVGVTQDIYGVLVPSAVFGASEVDQIRRRFMKEDGRFDPMIVMDWKPKGQINFNSNGVNKVMFQDIQAADFRPNRIANGNPTYIMVGMESLSTLPRRPDLAFVKGPQTWFDPTETQSIFYPYMTYINPQNGQVEGIETMDDEFIATKSGIMKYLWHNYYMDPDFHSLMYYCSVIGFNVPNTGVYGQINYIFSQWAMKLSNFRSEPFRFQNSTEIVMDLREVVIPLTSTWDTYGPWYASYEQAQGMMSITVDDTLVPWNFTLPSDIDPLNPNPPPGAGGDGLTPIQRLDNAGQERLARTLSPVNFLDTASITCAGFPEMGPAEIFGYNSNLTGISVDFGIGGVKTTYNLSTYSARPGTYRKGDYDNVSRARIDVREKLPDPLNENLVVSIISPQRNQFKD